MSKTVKKIRENKQTIRKVTLVIFITLLIWIWADLSVDETYKDSSATITISTSTDPLLWVRFENNNSPEFRLKQIELQGPAIRIAELKRDLAENSYQMRFTLDPHEFDIAESDSPITVSMMQVLREDKELRNRGLKVTGCTPESAKLWATKLVEKQLQIICLDEDNQRMIYADIQPLSIKMPVPQSWQGQSLQAIVKLTNSQAARSRGQAIEVKPYIELAPGIIRLSDSVVKVKLPENGINLENKTVPGSIGYVVSPDISEKYRIELENPEDFLTAISIKATNEAYQAFVSQKYKLLLEIKAEDAKSNPALSYPTYNFPQEFIQKGEIQAVEKLQQAKFRLIPRQQ